MTEVSSQPTDGNDERISNRRNMGWRFFHKRTLLLAFLLVVVPWLLIAIPGEGDLDADLIHLRHGWPLVHYDQFSLPGTAGLGTAAAPGPTHEQAKNMLRVFLADDEDIKFAPVFYSSSVKGKPKNISCRFDPRLAVGKNDGMDVGYWTNSSRYPGTGTHGSLLHLPGLILNLLILLAVLVLVCVGIEYRVRRKRLLRFSIGGVLFGVFLLSVLMAWQVRLAQKRNLRLVDVKRIHQDISPLSNSRFGFEVTKTRAQTPLVSALFDHRLTSFGKFEYVERIDHGHAKFGSRFRLPKDAIEKQAVIDAWNRVDYSTDISAEYSPDIMEFLGRVPKAKIESLELAELKSPLMGDPLGTNHRRRPFDQAEPAILPHLKRLTLEVPNADQEQFLDFFSECKHVPDFTIVKVDEKTAQYLIDHKWPSHIRLEWSYNLSEELSAQLKAMYNVHDRFDRRSMRLDEIERLFQQRRKENQLDRIESGSDLDGID